MLNISSIEDALYTWVYGVTGIETIFAHQNAPRPAGQYNLINIYQSNPRGIEESATTILPNKTIDIDYSNIEELSVSINTYRQDAFQVATKIKDSLGRLTVREVLFASGLGYVKANMVQEIPEVINDEWEERAQFDCFFHTRSSDTENIETIGQIEITNEIDGYNTTIKHPDL